MVSYWKIFICQYWGILGLDGKGGVFFLLGSQLDRYSLQFNYRYSQVFYSSTKIYIQSMQGLQRNMSSVETTTQKFHLREIPINSTADVQICKAIKKGNVKKFVNSATTTLKDISSDNIVDRGLEQHLLHLKKSCSELTRQLQDKQSQASKYRDEVGFVMEKAKKIKGNRENLQIKMADLERNLKQINTKKESALHSTKTYQHILERMKKDSIIKQLKKNQLQKEMKALEREYTATTSKNYSAIEFEKLSIIGLKEASEEVSQESTIRRNKLHCLNKESWRKLDFQCMLTDRQKQTDQIQDLGAGDVQDADLLRLKKFLVVQVFLRNLIKSKMNKLKLYYTPYENAFFEIKSNTSIKNAESLKIEFSNFEDSYNQRIAWVAHLQDEISETKEKNEKLKKQLNESMLTEMEMVEKMESQNKYNEPGNAKKFHEKSFVYECKWENVQSWIKIQAKKLNVKIEKPTEEQLLSCIIDKILSTTEENRQSEASVRSVQTADKAEKMETGETGQKTQKTEKTDRQQNLQSNKQ